MIIGQEDLCEFYIIGHVNFVYNHIKLLYCKIYDISYGQNHINLKTIFWSFLSHPSFPLSDCHRLGLDSVTVLPYLNDGQYHR